MAKFSAKRATWVLAFQTVLGTITLALVCAMGCGRDSGKPVEPQIPPKPNVLLITLDTTRADRLGAYGFGLARTANIDALAREGVVCMDCATTAPITMVAHASILTGLFPPAHGVRDNGTYALNDEAVTLAECLKQAGYDTHAAVSAQVLAKRYNLTQGFDSYDDELWEEEKPPTFMIPDRPGPKTARRSTSWLDTWFAKDDRPPFFMWAHFFDPHQPYESEVDNQHLMPSPYDAEIAQADEAVGILVDWLKGHGELDNTLIVVTADHGESLGEHGEKTHAIFVYDATIRVPLILRYPALLPAQSKYEGPVRVVDIMPTILSAVQLAGAENTQGYNLLTALQGKAEPPKLPQYCESLLSEVGFGMAPLFGIRLDGFKYIRAPKPELYNLKADPSELTNLHANSPDVVMRLDAELSKIIADSEQRALIDKRNPMDTETIDMLQALGYLSSDSQRHAMRGMDPKDGMTYYQKLEDARHLAQRDRYEDSEKLLREIVAELPRHLSARNTLAFVLMRQQKRDEAEKEYLESLATDPNQSRAEHMLGFIDLQKGDFEQAEVHYRKALEITPRFVEAMLQLGFVLAERGNMTEAQEWYDKAIQEDASSPRALASIADLYFLREDFARAMAQYEKALEKAPMNFHALVQAGVSATRTKEYDRAAAFYAQAVEVRNDSWIPEYNLACIRALQDKSEEAISGLRNAAKKGIAPARFAQLLATDTDLDSLRDIPSFKELLTSVNAPATPEQPAQNASP
ncbi:MAG: sulfatase-like hydrolase/transferase [Candidatus Hydrogenedentales bacterium]